MPKQNHINKPDVQPPVSHDLEKDNKFHTKKYRLQMKAAEGKQKPLKNV